ncbi:MAG: hypothetical protein AAF934_00220, partial [Bacteroidota bacterium]
MSNTVPHAKHHIQDGTSQEERMPDMLSPGYISIDERSQKELLDFAKALAGRMYYYNESNTQEGTWQDFLDDTVAGSSPQKALLLAFLKLFAYVQQDLNTLTGRHLDFYYNDVLRLKKKAATPDRLHVFFELAKNTKSHLLKAGTLLEAGKDKSGATIHYTTEKDIVINKATIGSLKTLFIEKSGGVTQHIYAAPMANTLNGLGTPFEKEEDIQWPTFGDPSTGKKASLGVAIATPLLLLREGVRTIDMVFTFGGTLPAAVNALVMANTFEVQLTGAKGWLQATVTNYTGTETLNANTQMGLSVQLNATQAAVTAYDSTLHTGNFEATAGWPLAKIILKDHSSYDLFNIPLQRITINVAVTGVSDLILQNDQGVLDTSQPMLPFGPQPVIGSSFYIGSSEAFQKKLNNLTVHMEWLDAPGNFNTHYSGYGAVAANGSNFQAELSLLHKKSWLTSPAPLDPHFELFVDNTGKLLTVPAYTGYTHEPDPQVITAYDQTVQTGFIKLELTAPTTPFNAFGHAMYPNLHTVQAIGLANATPNAQLPNAPYTPTIKSLRLDYTATQTIDFSTYASNNLAKLFHIRPFGNHTYQSGTPSFLLPQYTDEGTLYIGVKDLAPPQQLSILFRPAEGSAAPNNNIKDGAIRWHYLGASQWTGLQNRQVISDTTMGLQASGIVTLDIPGDASSKNSIMPGGVHWLKATVTTKAKDAGKLIALHTQVVTARFTDRGNDPGQTGQLLAAKSVSGLAVRQSAVKRVIQPYPSFGGRVAEQSNAFYTRISERLRHKHRALTAWDYERLVLEQFPDLYSVKCLSNTAGLSTGSEDQPGHVSVAVVPGRIRETAKAPLEPRVNTKTLTAIETYLKQYTSPFVRVSARNHTYEALQFRFKVGFTEGVDQGYYQQFLEEELKQFLAPWAYGGGLRFSNPIYKSAVLDFVEKRPYVNVVIDFIMLHSLQVSKCIPGNSATAISTTPPPYRYR